MAEDYGWAYNDRENGRPVNLGDRPFDPHNDDVGYDDDDWEDDDDDWVDDTFDED